VAEGPRLEKNGKVIIKTIASFPSLMLWFREGNSLYSKKVTVMQLLIKNIYGVQRIKIINDCLRCFQKLD